VPAVLLALVIAIGPASAQNAPEMPSATGKTTRIARAPEPVAVDPVDAEKALDVAEVPTPADAAGLAAAAAAAALTPIVRDPFWPPGFDPAPPVEDSGAPRVEIPVPSGPPPVRLPEPGPADWAAAARQLKPRVGHSVDPEGNEVFFALLNNRLLAIGKTVSASTSLFACSWRVGRITAAGVELIPVEARRLSDGKRFLPPKRETD
jgi:hypothetical protein